jgi:hypothetical protein
MRTEDSLRRHVQSYWFLYVILLVSILAFYSAHQAACSKIGGVYHFSRLECIEPRELPDVNP